jgi:ankyrin repeat protein
MQALLAANADVNAATIHGHTPLHAAAGRSEVIGNYISRERATTAVSILLAAGAAIEARDSGGQTPLHQAARAGYAPVCELLVAHGADCQARDNEAATPLHLAAKSGNSRCCEILLARGADIHALDKEGNTPLLWALTKHRDSFSPEAADYLLNHGADVARRNATGDNPFLVAAYWGHCKAIPLLLLHGASLTDTNNSGDSALHLAAINGWHDVVRMLLDVGADPDVLSGKGRTLAQTAAAYGRADVLALLNSRSSHAVAPSLDRNTLTFQPTCLNCDRAMEQIDTQGWPLLSRTIACRSCGEIHRYIVHDRRLHLKRITVPSGHSGPSSKEFAPENTNKKEKKWWGRLFGGQ